MKKKYKLPAKALYTFEDLSSVYSPSGKDFNNSPRLFFTFCWAGAIPPDKPVPSRKPGPVTPEQKEIPNFDVYSLFLFPDGHWVDANKNDVEGMLKAFERFGDAIGDSKAAIWFYDETKNYPDIQRSKKYFKIFNLQYEYHDGPFIVITNKHPDAFANNDEKIVISLRELEAPSFTKILNVLEKDLTYDRKIRKRKLLYEEVQGRILKFVKSNKGFLQNIFIKFFG